MGIERELRPLMEPGDKGQLVWGLGGTRGAGEAVCREGPLSPAPRPRRPEALLLCAEAPEHPTRARSRAPRNPPDKQAQVILGSPCQVLD